LFQRRLEIRVHRARLGIQEFPIAVIFQFGLGPRLLGGNFPGMVQQLVV
jgi:hypothetical protein